MKKSRIIQLVALAGIVLFGSCSKSEKTTLSTPPFQIGQIVSSTSPLCGSIKGTMQSGKTYTVSCDVTVNKGDTLYLQPGVKVNITGKYSVNILGTFISVGNKDSVNWITYAGLNHSDVATQSPATDPAFSGSWYGINCDTTCALFVMKWTHVEFAGATVSAGEPAVSGLTAGSPSYMIFFQNINGKFILEDSWIYGSVDDAVHITSGLVSIMRNTFEKCGLNSGENLNIKSGSVGDVAYNLFIGGATNGFKSSNAGATAIQEKIYCYNNTIVDEGYRQSTPAGHGASINYEKQASGKIYNNLIVNSRVGLRIVNTDDTVNTAYGNNYNYGDSLSVVNMFYPPADVTRPQPTDIPATATWISNPASLVSANNPNFKNFPLPNYNYINVNYAAGFDFHLNTGSPAIGKGTTGFSALGKVAVNAIYGPSEVTQPGADIGAYQTNGTGNQH